MRSIDCQHPSPFALHHLPPPPPPPLLPSLPPIRATPSPCLVRALTFSLFLSLLFVVLYCAAICSPLLLPHGDVSFLLFARARFVVALFLPPLFLLLTLHSPPRGGLSAMGQLFVYMARTGVSAQYRAGRDRIARRYSRYAISRECAICNCYRVRVGEAEYSQNGQNGVRGGTGKFSLKSLVARDSLSV